MKQAITDMHNPQVKSSMHTLPSLGFEVRVLTAGTGPAVLMLHGNPDSADEWRNVMGLLSDQFRCIAPDFPGYGESPKPPSSFAYDRAAQMAFVDDVLKALEVQEPVIVVVHDVGGFVGTPWVHANMSRTKGMLFLNTVAYEGFEWFDTAKKFGARSLWGRFLGRLMMFAIGQRGGAPFRRLFRSQSPQLAKEEIARFTRSFALNANAKDATLRQFRHATKDDFFDGFDEMNRAITSAIPTQVLWGEQDVYLDDKYAQRFGSAPVTMLPGVGHWVPIVAPDKVAEAIAALAK